MATASPFALLREPDPLRLWAAGSLASVVRWLEGIAFAIWAYDATQSPLASALTLAARFGPLLAFGPLAPAMLARFDQRAALSGATRAMAGLALIVAAATFALGPSLPLLCFYSLAAGFYMCVDRPIRRTLTADAVGRERIAAAMGLEGVSVHATRALGPLAGGAIYQFLGVGGVLAAATLIYLAAALALAGLRVTTPPRIGPAASIARIVGDGVKAARAEPILAGVLFATVAINLLPIAYAAVGPALAAQRFALEPWLIGALLASEGAGGATGSLLMSAYGETRAFLRLFLGGAALFCAGVALFALAPTPTLAALALYAAGVGLAAFSVLQATLPLLIAPDHLRAQLAGLVLFCIGAGPIGFLLIGVAAEATTPGTAALTFALTGGLTIAFAAWRWPVFLGPLDRDRAERRTR